MEAERPSVPLRRDVSLRGGGDRRRRRRGRWAGSSAWAGSASTGTSTSTVEAGPAGGDGFILPATATLPWELEMGFAFQLGPRPLNPPWLDPYDMERAVRERIDRARAARQAEYARELVGVPPEERDGEEAGAGRARGARSRAIEDQELDSESARLRGIRKARERNWPRERITILGSILVTGPSTNAVSLEGFATQTQETVGAMSRSRPGWESRASPSRLARRPRRVLPRALTLRGRDGAAALHLRWRLQAVPVQPVGRLRRPGVARELLGRPRPALPELRDRVRGVALRRASSAVACRPARRGPSPGTST